MCAGAVLLCMCVLELCCDVFVVCVCTYVCWSCVVMYVYMVELCCDDVCVCGGAVL